MFKPCEKGQDLDYEEYKRTHSGAGIATIVISFQGFKYKLFFKISTSSDV